MAYDPKSTLNPKSLTREPETQLWPIVSLRVAGFNWLRDLKGVGELEV